MTTGSPVEGLVEVLRPSMRGVVHRWAAPVAALAGLALVARGHDLGDRTVLAVYGLCVTAMLAVSATYHSGRLSPAAEVRCRRLDHTTILLCIAGSYTAVSWFALEGSARTRMLVATWAVTVVGTTLRLAWMGAPRWCTAAVYLAAGWMVVVDWSSYRAGTTSGQQALLVIGGLLYSLGGVTYALRWPDPWPHRFGFHEVFHTLVVAAAASIFAAVASLAA